MSLKKKNLKEIQFFIDFLFNDKKITKKEIERLNFNNLVTISSYHLLLPALFKKIENSKKIKFFPKDFIKYIKEIYKLNLERNLELINEMRIISNELNKFNVSHCYIKGASILVSNKNYLAGERMLNDIDILVSGKDIIKYIEVMDKLGYKFINEKQYDFHRHLPRQINKNKLFAVECHKTITDKNHIFVKPESILINKQKIDNFFVPDFINQIKICIYNSEINDFNYFYQSYTLKSYYDVIKILTLQKVKISTINQDLVCKNFLMKGRELNILKFKKISNLNNPDLMVLRFKIKEKYRLFFILDNFLTKNFLYLKKIFSKINLFLNSKNYRNYKLKK